MNESTKKLALLMPQQATYPHGAYMDLFESMTFFTRVVETGSFSAVAKEFNTTQPTVSKKVAELEKHLNTKLFRRSTRSINLTDSGSDYYARSLNILQDIEEAELSITSLQSETKGIVKVTTSVAFGNAHIIPILSEFFKAHPGLQINLYLTDQNVDLIQQGVDIAIRMGHLPDSILSARQVCSSPLVTVATQQYFEHYGYPTHPLELSRHECLIYSGRKNPLNWHFMEDAIDFSVTVKGRFITNDAAAYRAALISGLGVGVAPRWLVGDLIQAGTLQTVCNKYSANPMPIHAVFPPGKHVSEKVRCFTDFLTDKIKICENINR